MGRPAIGPIARSITVFPFSIRHGLNEHYWHGFGERRGCTVKEKRSMIDQGHAGISISRQCELLNLPRSTYYYTAQPADSYNLELMDKIDRHYTKWPFLGYRRITKYLNGIGQKVNKKRVARLMSTMGIAAIHPKRKTTVSHPGHKKYPYLLRDVEIESPNHVWGSDITYIGMHKGFAYLVAIMDWYSRYVISWELSNTMDTGFCMSALDSALSGRKPEIFNTDQGSQFTSLEFTGRLAAANVRISMDGRGRVYDNIFVERLWRTVKYEEVYLYSYESLWEAQDRLDQYFKFYNRERHHQSLGYRTPEEVYHEM